MGTMLAKALQNSDGDTVLTLLPVRYYTSTANYFLAHR